MVAGRRQLKKYNVKKGGTEMINDVHMYIHHVLKNDNYNAKYIIDKYRNNKTFKSTVLHNLFNYTEQQKNKVKSHLFENMGDFTERIGNFTENIGKNVFGFFAPKKAMEQQDPRNNYSQEPRYNPPHNREAIPDNFLQPHQLRSRNHVETTNHTNITQDEFYKRLLRPHNVTEGDVVVGNQSRHEQKPVRYPGDTYKEPIDKSDEFLINLGKYNAKYGRDGAMNMRH